MNNASNERPRTILKALLWNIIPIIITVFAMMSFNDITRLKSKRYGEDLARTAQILQKDHANERLLREFKVKADSLLGDLRKAYDQYFTALANKSSETAYLLTETESRESKVRMELGLTLSKLVQSNNESVCRAAIEDYRQILNLLSVNWKPAKQELILLKNANNDGEQCEKMKAELENKVETLQKENDDLRSKNIILQIKLERKP